MAQEIEQTMLVNPFKKGGDYFKLLPTQIDRNGFKNLVEGTETSVDGRISQCYQFFQRKLKQSTVSVNALNKVVTNRLSVVSIVLDFDDNPHLVFESLNAKGRPLTQSDLIRNYFFMRIHADEQVRSFIKPKSKCGLAYVDYSQQEFGIAGALSGDQRMIAAYQSGDPYLTFGKQAGAIPSEGTKED